jgi:excisionase family DNA binding protein
MSAILQPDESAFLTVSQAASFLNVSTSWVRRHIRELPSVHVGCLVRFDASLLHRAFQSRTVAGNRLKPERTMVPTGFRRYQRGSVLKRGKKGQQTWYGMWREDVLDADGGFIRRQRNVKLGAVAEIPNCADALDKLAVLMNQKPSVRLEFSELFERWKAAVVPTLKDSTANNYVYNLKTYLVPAFGNREVSAINRYEVETFLAGKAKMYCRNTLRGMRASLGRILSWAVVCDWIEKNPCAGVKLPNAGSKVKRTILTPQQVIAIAARLEEPYSTLILFLAVTGLRVGEAVGIKWADFEGDTLHVQRRIYERREGTTKKRGSTRSVPIPSVLLERMRTLGDGEWIFRSRAGTPVDPKNAANRHIRPTAKALGIVLGGWHDFRHTLSTQLLRRYPAKVVAGLLGHSNVQTTLAIYQHVETEDFRAPLNETANELLCDVIKPALAAA